MNETSITDHITGAFEGVDIATVAGVTFFFYDPEQKFPFATLVTVDNDFDRFSDLDRPGVFRLNVGVGKETYRRILGDATEETGHDFTALDRLMPHPIYGKMHWLCVLNPSEATFETVKPLLAEAYERSVRQQREKGKA